MASLVLITIFIIIFSFTSEIQAKSLYVDMHNDAIVKAYKITGDQIQYQTDAQNSPSYTEGGPGIMGTAGLLKKSPIPDSIVKQMVTEFQSVSS